MEVGPDDFPFLHDFWGYDPESLAGRHVWTDLDRDDRELFPIRREMFADEMWRPGVSAQLVTQRSLRSVQHSLHRLSARKSRALPLPLEFRQGAA
jgi:hypothetical protein